MKKIILTIFLGFCIFAVTKSSKNCIKQFCKCQACHSQELKNNNCYCNN